MSWMCEITILQKAPTVSPGQSRGSIISHGYVHLLDFELPVTFLCDSQWVCESRQLTGTGSLCASFHLPLSVLDESCVEYYHILGLLYVCFSAKNTKKILHLDIWLQNHKQNKVK